VTTLATNPLDDPDQIALFGDSWTTLGKPLADTFRDACETEAREHGGWVNPNAVRARLLDDPAYEPRQYAALWSVACSRDGYLDKTDRPVRIAGAGSRGNTNKSTTWRKWRTA
jgi:hypothetical protein